MRWRSQSARGISFLELEKLRIDLTKKHQAGCSYGDLLFSEPQSTYTAGRSANTQDFLGQRELAKIVPVGRGGKWTYHGPGQIVVYPIVSLKLVTGSSRKVSWFLNRFREAISNALIQIGVRAMPLDSPFGLYVNQEKIVSFGVSVERGVISHGAAIYGTDQRLFFENINPCGVPALRVTSVEAQLGHFDWDAQKKAIQSQIESHFDFPEIQKSSGLCLTTAFW